MIEEWRARRLEELQQGARALAESASRIAAVPGGIIRGRDTRDSVAVGLNLSAEVVEVKLAQDWRDRISPELLGPQVCEARERASLEYLRLQIETDRPGVVWEEIPRTSEPEPIVESGGYSLDEMFCVLEAQREEIPRYQEAAARAEQERVVIDDQARWARAVVTGESIVSFDLESMHMTRVSDAVLEQIFVRLYRRATDTYHDLLTELERSFPATARARRMSTAIQAAAHGQFGYNS